MSNLLQKTKIKTLILGLFLIGILLQGVRSQIVTCQQNEIADESSNTCLKTKENCKNKLSSDFKQCLLKCPYSEIEGDTVGSYVQCKKCEAKTPYSTSDSKLCVAQCSEAQELIYEKVKSSCIKKEQCDGYILDSKNTCLKNTCEVLIATQVQSSIKLLPKESGKKYQICNTCPKESPFLSYSFKDQKASNCMNCISEGLIQDYVAGKCSKLLDLLQKAGHLDITGTMFLPSDQKCPDGQYLLSVKIAKPNKVILKCAKCKPGLISSKDGLNCIRKESCNNGHLYNEENGGCINKGQCKKYYFISSDQTSCTSKCPNGEIQNAKSDQCIKCPLLKPISNQERTQCLSKCPDQYIYDTQQQECIKQQFCQDGLYLQVDGKTCDQLCYDDQVYGRDQSLTYNICLDCTNKYRLEKDGYTISCGDSCPQGYYGNPETLTCLPNSGCDKFLSGPIPNCSDACQSDEYIYDKDPNETFTKCSKDCKYFKFLNSDGFNTCTQKCNDYVDSNNNCVKQCPSEEYLNPKENPDQTYIKCTKTCKNYYQYDDGQQKCVNSCDVVQSSDAQKKTCAKSCKQGEIAIDQENTLEYDYICTLADKCPKNYSSFTENNIQKCSKVCPLYQSINGQSCLEKCQDGQFAVEKPDGKFIRYVCSDKCEKQKFQYKDENGITRCTNKCYQYLQSDQQTCGSSCKKEEFILEKKPDDTSFQCASSCDKFQFLDEKSQMKMCVSQCPMYLSSDKQTCIKSCPAKEYIMDRLPGQKYFKCVEKCEGYEYTDKEGIKRCSKYCQYYLQSDKKACDKSCQKGEYINDKTFQYPYFYCSAKCEDFEYYLEDQIKRCTKRCPLQYVESKNSENQKICIKKSECKGVISQDGSKCIEKCDQNKKQYIKSFQNFKQCFVCKKYYIIEKDVASCLDECPNDQVGLPSEMLCVSSMNASKECESFKFKLSSDKKKCSEKCQYPEVTNSKGQCKKACSSKDSSCQKCEKDELSYSDGSVENCIPASQCTDYISSDGKRCISDCSIVSELSQDNSKTCVKCKADEIPIFSDQKITCQKKDESKIIDQKLKSAKNFVNQLLDSKDKVEEVKKQIEDLSKDIFEKVKQKNQPIKDLIKSLVSIAQDLVNSITLSDLSLTPQTVGTKENIITCVQKKKQGYKFKKQFSLDNVQNGTGELLEDDSEQSSNEDINVLSASAVAQNPACLTEECKKSPLFQIDIQLSSRRILQQNQQKPFQVTFNADKPDQIKKYVCLSYNLDDPSQKPTKMETTINSDNKSVTCAVYTNVSILFDSLCDYVDKSYCSINNEEVNEDSDNDDDDGLSSGAIAGIVIGVLALVGIGTFLGVFFYRRHQQKQKQNQYVETNKSPDRSPELGPYDTAKMVDD